MDVLIAFMFAVVQFLTFCHIMVFSENGVDLSLRFWNWCKVTVIGMIVLMFIFAFL